MPTPADVTAVILTGGRARRLGGRDKASLQIGGSTLLERALAATEALRTTVVVGSPTATSRSVTWTREEPAGGGPAAALLAGASLVGTPWLLALAVDMPWVDTDTVARLLAGARGDGALLVDEQGRAQFLAAVYDARALRSHAPAEPADTSLRALVGGLDLTEVAALPGEADDVDTPEDLDRLD